MTLGTVPREDAWNSTRDARAPAFVRGSIPIPKLLIVAFHQLTERGRHGVAVHGDHGVLRVAFGEFFRHTITQLDERIQDAHLEMIDLWGCIVALVVDAHRAGVVERAGVAVGG